MQISEDLDNAALLVNLPIFMQDGIQVSSNSETEETPIICTDGKKKTLSSTCCFNAFLF